MAYTPWGKSDSSTRLATGVMEYGTPSHGGIHVTDKVRAAWPDGLREYPPFAGQGWYEEDEDWAVVVAAMPELFNGSARYYAAQTLLRMTQREPGGNIARFWNTDIGRTFAIAADRLPPIVTD